jgi:hypothetical protein
MASGEIEEAKVSRQAEIPDIDRKMRQSGRGQIPAGWNWW